MDYFVCTGCTHTTLDHEMYAPRPCLLCDCKTMINGGPFVKPKYVKDPNVDYRIAAFKPKEKQN